MNWREMSRTDDPIPRSPARLQRLQRRRQDPSAAEAVTHTEKHKARLWPSSSMPATVSMSISRARTATSSARQVQTGLTRCWWMAINRAAFPKSWLHRRTLGRPLLHLHGHHVIAVAADTPLETSLPQLGVDRPKKIARSVFWLIGQHRISEHAEPYHPHCSQLR